MVDRGPLLTSAIIFYLAIGAAIFEVLEEPHWKEAKNNYYTQKLRLQREFPCLSQEGLDKILQVVSDAAGQGVAIMGNQTFNNWNWPNAMIFAATVITTIGYGNVAPKTPAGRLFCVFYGLFGVPLCLTWISALGKFFGGRAKRLGQFLTRRGMSLRKAQITCTAIFILWGVLVHLVIPPFVFMVTEEWNYIEGLYYSFITISTIGFGDFVAGVNPSANYHALYRYFVELWIYLGLAWLSLFVWKVSMFFSFLSKKEETYNDLIKQIGKKAMKTSGGGERVAGPGPRLGSQGNGLPGVPASLVPLVVYSKNRVPSLEEVSQTLRNKGHVSRPPGEEVGDPEAGSPTSETFSNQLDRISEEGEPWEALDYQPLILQTADITFVSEEAGVLDEETSKSSLEDNLAGEEPPPEGAAAQAPLNVGEIPSSSDESTFTSTESELSVPYEQLMNEYNKASSPRGT
uniref:Potassium two pore domain channel subfamily K member 5 n=1 Tax=Cavia porcellus TaxID=10141 RepID=H0W7U5_CAVPO